MAEMSSIADARQTDTIFQHGAVRKSDPVSKINASTSRVIEIRNVLRTRNSFRGQLKCFCDTIESDTNDRVASFKRECLFYGWSMRGQLHNGI